eukprot:2288966-Prymnesium_polylepis.1
MAAQRTPDGLATAPCGPPPSAAARLAEGIWSAWTSRYSHLGADVSGTHNAASRRQAHQDEGEDWFISIANKIFEV